MKTLAPLLLFLLATCADDRPSAPDAEQSEQLNEAEEMLNAVADEQSQ